MMSGERTMIRHFGQRRAAPLSSRATRREILNLENWSVAH
jgi:hypothetical protein